MPVRDEGGSLVGRAVAFAAADPATPLAGDPVEGPIRTADSVMAVAARRAAVQVGPTCTFKRHRSPEAAEAEAAWYERVPWAAPRLLDVDGATLVLETLPVALRLPGWRPAAALRDLLLRLHAEGIHHRDVHVRNLVRGPSGPLLIDWETAIHQPSELSYDLYGPDASGVPVPEIHAQHIPQWWGSAQRMSIKSQWGCDVPAEAA